MLTEDALRAQMEAKFGSLPEFWWSDLVEQDYVAAALRRRSRGAMADLEARIRFYSSVAGQGPRMTLNPVVAVGPLPLLQPQGKGRNAWNWLWTIMPTYRSKVFSAYLAKVAGATPTLTEFRRTHLSGWLLSDHLAREFIKTPSIRYMSIADFQRVGVLPFRCSSRARGLMGIKEDQRTFVWTAHVELTIDGKIHVEVLQSRFPITPAINFAHCPHLSLPEFFSPTDRTTYFPGSFFERLHFVATELMGQCPWSEEQAMIFALTDEPPLVMPRFEIEQVTGKHFSRTVVTLKVEPWMSPREVRDGYIAIRNHYCGRQRQPDRRSQTLFGFVVERMQGGGILPGWRALTDEWNRLHGSIKRYDHAWRFHRDWDRAKALIAFARPWRTSHPQPPEDK